MYISEVSPFKISVWNQDLFFRRIFRKKQFTEMIWNVTESQGLF